MCIVLCAGQLTACSVGPTPITNTFPPKDTDFSSALRREMPGCAHVDGGPDGTFETCTLQRNPRHHPHCLFNLLSVGLRGILSLEEDSPDCRNEGFGEFKSGFHEVGDGYRGTSSRMRSEECDETDGSCSAGCQRVFSAISTRVKRRTK